MSNQEGIPPLNGKKLLAAIAAAKKIQASGTKQTPRLPPRGASPDASDKEED